MITLNQISAEQLSTVAGVVISLLAFYLPRVGPWYNAQPAQVKAQVMGAAVISVGLISFLLAYFNIGPFTLGANVPAGQAVWSLLLTIFSALVSNQSTFVLMSKLQQPSLAAINAHGAVEVADPIGDTRART